MKQAILRPQAEEDLVSKSTYYLDVDYPSTALAERFFDSANLGIEQIQKRPGIGSLRIGHLRNIPRLRSWPIKGFSMQWYYFELADYLDVVRLLADREDNWTLRPEDRP